MEYLIKNESGHWLIENSKHVLHSGDPVRVMLDGLIVPARIQLDEQVGQYVVIIDGGEKIIALSPSLDVRAVLDGIL